MGNSTLWISESQVVAAIDLGDAVAALTRGFAEEGRGRAVAMDKTMIGFGDHATLHALGASFDADHLVATKTWAHTPGGADPQLLVFDANDGSLLSVIEAFALGQLRTAGTAALATERLARQDARRMAIIGTGKQALAQVAAVASVRRLSEVRCFSRDAAKRAQFAGRVADELGVPGSAMSSVDEAVEGADVITLVTRATEAVLRDDMVGPGVHVNAVGAIALDRREFEPSLLGRCEVVATDSLSQCMRLSSELRDFYGADPDGWASVETLGGIVAAGRERSSAGDITLFKGMGSGIEDLSLAREVLARVRESEQGWVIERTGRAKPRLGRSPATVQGGGDYG